MEKKNIMALDLIRVIFCIAILLYHLGILKGGFLAVSSFFVLSSYLSTRKALKSDKFSWKEYYLGIFTRIYIPMIVVIFLSLVVLSVISKMPYINLKPEVTSILFSYNNYWQLSANLDYFTKNISSPFTHLWYISILIQYQLVFPFFYLCLDKVRKKVNKKVPVILLSILAITGTIYFYLTSLQDNIMFTYYSTFTRLFSLLFGVLLGFIITDFQIPIPKWIHKKKLVFYSYFVLQILLFVLVDSSSNLFPISLILTTFITTRLITYGVANPKEQDNWFTKIIKYISSISYEIYLIQYPVIYLFQEVKWNAYLKIILIIGMTLILSMILHYILNWKNKKSRKIPKFILRVFILIPVLYGFYVYVMAQDYTEEINQLKEQLDQNKINMMEKQKEYLSQLTDEKNNFENALKELEENEKNLEEIVTNLSIVGIGDSVMLNAVNHLYQKFPNGYFNAEKNRTDYEVYDIVDELNRKNKLSDIIIFNLGTNGECPQKCKEEYLKVIGNRKIFWVNATHPDYPIFNTRLKELAASHDNISIIDWIEASKDHPEYLIADGTHLTDLGKVAYTETIYKALSDYFLDEIKKEKEIKLKEQEQLEKRRITFIGNDLILNVYDKLQENHYQATYLLNSEYTFSSLKDTIIKSIEEESLSYKVVLAFDKKLSLSKKEYEELIRMCNGHEIYIIYLNEYDKFSNDNVKIIDFNREIKNHSNYLMMDNIHLTEEGNEALDNMIKNYLEE